MKQLSKRNTNIEAAQLIELGKLPPQAIDMEEVVLGALMLDRDCLDRVMTILLKAECFYKEAHQRIFKAMQTMYFNSEPIDILTVTQQVKKSEELELCGGAFYISSLTNRIASAANVEVHARIVLEKYMQRELIRICTESLMDSYADSVDIFELFASAEQRLSSVVNGVSRYEVSTIRDIHRANVRESIIVAESGHASGIMSGLKAVDKLTNGWQDSDLVIIAGRPGMGKSASVVSMAIYPALKENQPVAIFSLEMSKSQIVGRIESILSGFNVSRIIKKQLIREEIISMDEACSVLNNAPIHIDDTPSLPLLELKAKARRLVKEQGVRLIVVDYLQLMVSGLEKVSREQEVAHISKGLKALAKELDVPIIALSQLSRVVEGRADKKPQLSDLRESGSVEQDADMVLFCYRPEQYGIETYELDGESLSTKGLFIFIVEKHRNGDVGEIALTFVKENTKLVDYVEQSDYSYSSEEKTKNEDPF